MIFSSQLGKINTASPQEGIAQVANHIRKMQEELEYRLMNLSSDNISEIDLGQTSIYSGDAQLTQIIQQTSGQYSAISQKVSGISAEVADLKKGLGMKVTLDANGLWVENAAGIKTQITGSHIKVSSLTEDDVHTLITGDLVSSPTIKGGTFSSLNDKAWIKMAEKKGLYETEYGLVLYDETNHQDGIFSVWSGDFGYTVFSSKLGYGFLQTNADPATKTVTVYPLGHWDFSNCDSLTADMTVTAVFAP